MNTDRHPAAARFPRVGGHVSVGGLPLPLIAARAGSTPFYVYDRQLMKRRVDELRSALPASISLHYAMKANPMPAVVGWMARWVDGLDVASGGELRVALDSGMDPQEISFAGPGKSETELMQAVASGVLTNVESERELHLLAEAGRRLGRQARVAIRVNPDFELKSSGMKMGGGPKQFGIDAEEVPGVIARARRVPVSLEGFHIYSGSQNLRAESICESQTKALDLAVRLAGHGACWVRTLNLGGGFGIPYFPGEQPLELAPIGQHLARLAEIAADTLPAAKLVVELGRYLVGEAGLYVARVVERKISRGQVFLVVDGGLHHHLAASGNFGQVLRKNYPVEVSSADVAAPIETASVVGPLCTPLDLLAERMPLRRAQAGDLIVVYQSGAYGATASPQAFLTHPRPVELLV